MIYWNIIHDFYKIDSFVGSLIHIDIIALVLANHIKPKQKL